MGLQFSPCTEDLAMLRSACKGLVLDSAAKAELPGIIDMSLPSLIARPFVAGGGFFDSAVGSQFASRSETRSESPKKAAPKRAAPTASASGMFFVALVALNKCLGTVTMKQSGLIPACFMTGTVFGLMQGKPRGLVSSLCLLLC